MVQIVIVGSQTFVVRDHMAAYLLRQAQAMFNTGDMEACLRLKKEATRIENA